MIFNFSGAFWGNLRNFRNSQAFDELLSKPETTLEQVLDDEDVVQELKNQNPKLIALYALFSFTPERLRDLLSLLVTEPPLDADHRRGHKHPFLAAELIGCEAPQLLQSLFEDPSLLSLFFSLLSSPSLNLTLAGYFSKLFHILTSRNSPRLLHTLCNPDSPYLPQLIQQINAKSIADCVLRVLVYDDGEEFVQERRGIVEKLVEITAESSEKAVNSVGILSDCLQKSSEMKGWKAVFAPLFSIYTVNRLLEGLLSPSSSALSLLTLVLGHSCFTELVGEGILQLKERLEGSIPLLEAILEGKNTSETAIPSGNTVGEVRLKCLELLFTIFKADIQAFEGVIAQSRLPELATYMFFAYPWSSFLHQTYFQLIQSVLYCTDLDIKGVFLRKSDIVTRLLEWKTEVKLESGKSLRAGYMGHAIRIGQLLAKAFEASPDLQPTATTWSIFLSDTLNPLLELESRPYGGSKPTDTLEDDSDEQNDIKEEVGNM